MAEQPDAGADATYRLYRAGDGKAVRRAIADGADFNHFEVFRGGAPLDVATAGNHVAVCRTLLEAGADADKLDYDGNSALYYAKVKKRKKLIKLLEPRTSEAEREAVKRRLSKEAKERERRDQALFDAIQAGDLPRALKLVEERPEGVNEPLFGESLIGRVVRGPDDPLRPLVVRLLDMGARPDVGVMPALYQLCVRGDEDLELVEKAARASETVDPRTLYDQYTPLVAAARNAQTQTIELLLSRGADPNARDRLNHSVLWHARKWEEFKGKPNPVVPILLRAGAQV